MLRIFFFVPLARAMRRTTTRMAACGCSCADVPSTCTCRPPRNPRTTSLKWPRLRRPDSNSIGCILCKRKKTEEKTKWSVQQLFSSGGSTKRGVVVLEKKNKKKSIPTTLLRKNRHAISSNLSSESHFNRTVELLSWC